MFRIVDVELRKVLTYQDATPITYGSEELAKSHAAEAQARTGNPHAVLHLASPALSSLGRVRAPWIPAR